MIKDYQNKEVLAEMKRQVNAAAKISDREARITFVLIHMISEYHILAEQCNKPDGENNLFRFISWCLSRFAEELETPSNRRSRTPSSFTRKIQISICSNSSASALRRRMPWRRGLTRVLSGPIMFPTKSGKRTSCRQLTQLCLDFTSLTHQLRT